MSDEANRWRQLTAGAALTLIIAAAGASTLGITSATAQTKCDPQVDHLEFTQAIQKGIGQEQDEDPSGTTPPFPDVPMVDGKATTIRAYISEENEAQGCPDIDGDGQPDIAGWFKVESPTQTAGSLGLPIWIAVGLNPRVPSQLKPNWDRQVAESTQNYTFMPDLVTGSDRPLDIVVCVGVYAWTTQGGALQRALTPTSCESQTVTFTFKTRPDFLGVKVIDSDTEPLSNKAIPGDQMLWATLPLPDGAEGLVGGGYSYDPAREVRNSRPLNDPAGREALNNKLNDRFCDWADGPGYIYGWLSSGSSIDIGGSAESQSQLTAAHGVDDSSVYRTIFAHENTHNFLNTRQNDHDDDPLTHVGWDVLRRIAGNPVKAIGTGNLMNGSVSTAHDNNRWADRNLYVQLLGQKRLYNPSCPAGCPRCRGQAAFPPQNPPIPIPTVSHYRISGDVPLPTSTPSALRASFHITRELHIVTEVITATSAARIQTRDLTGTVISETMISLYDESMNHFIVALPASPSVEDIALVRDGVVLDTITKSLHSPALAIVAPVQGQAITDTLFVSWNATDLDGDETIAGVSFSPADGGSWIPVSDWVENASAVQMSTVNLPATATGRVRVTVSDGFHTTEAAVSGLQIGPNRTPAATIISPVSGAIVYLQENTVLYGQARDAEDGYLYGSSLVWTSSVDGFLGVGTSLNLDQLSAGLHTIFLQATDSANQATMDSVTVTVVLN